MDRIAEFVEEVTPLDLLMPKIYVVITLTFRATQPTISIVEHLQPGLNQLNKQIPWLSGRVFSMTGSAAGTGEAGGTNRDTPEIRWSTRDPAPKLVDKGTIEDRYEDASARGMPLASLTRETWPVPGMVDDFPAETGAPVFAASVFRFADGQGIGLCVCMHHYAVDATGMGEILRIWGSNAANPISPAGNDSEAVSRPNLETMSQGRCVRLAGALASPLNTASTQAIEEIWACHPEYSKIPPTFPENPLATPSCSTRLFNIPIREIFAQRELLKSAHPELPIPTTNTLLTSLIWSTITTARMKRDPSLVSKQTRLAMAVNARPRISANFSTPQRPYLANAVLTALTEASVAGLSTCYPPQPPGADPQLPGAFSIDALASATAALSRSTKAVSPDYVAQVHSLITRTENYRAIYAGWDLFNNIDLTITSWAGLDFLYEVDFGPALGKTDFVRVPGSEIDGICGVLPRRRVFDSSRQENEEVLEVIVSLRDDDMAALLDEGGFWRRVAREIG